VLCQQCDNAPCEPVCPVYATYHNPEGLNVQVYNRCVGTFYCANNCPYTVRYFNWFAPQWPEPLELQHNPDVAVRMGGVMEKCTFCIQRIKRAKEDASQDRRPLADGEVQPACVQSCPAEAMVFGDLNDPQSKVSRLAGSGRSTRLLEELGTRPKVFYLEKVK
jgi:molybdopterin-containing oxidoreductase family iron-sulfur binding subunit